MESLGKVPVISTPLEKYPVDGDQVLNIAKQYHTIAILLKNYVLPLALTADESIAGNQMYYFCLCPRFNVSRILSINSSCDSK